LDLKVERTALPVLLDDDRSMARGWPSPVGLCGQSVVVLVTVLS
jgi:hypothetical protein